METINEMNEPFRLAAKIESNGKHPVFKRVMANDNGEVLLVAFHRDVEVERHHVHANVMVQVLDGEVEFTIYGHPDRQMIMKEGDVLLMEPDTEHSLRGIKSAKVLVTKVNA